MTEAELEREVRRMLTQWGLYGYHAPDSRRSAPGFPDWVIIGPGRPGVLWRELKSPYGALSAAQRNVGWHLQRAGQDWDVWRPLDFKTGRIGAELLALAG